MRPVLHGPALEMLWEDADAGDALEERFGHADAAAAGRWVAGVVERHWGLRIGSCTRVVISDRNALAWLTTASGPVLAKWSVAAERFPRLAEVARLTAWLGHRGLPVSAGLPALDGALQVEVDGVSIGLQRVVRGDLLDVGDPVEVRDAGAALARLHASLAAYPDAGEVVADLDRPTPLADRVLGWLDAAGPQVPVTARDALRRLVDAAPSGDLPVQVVHGDFRASNVLCADGAVVAVIDLEEARPDHAVVELVRSAVMLGTRFRDWGPVPPAVRTTFRAGYESGRPLTPVEARWWDVVVLWQAWALVPPGDDPTGWGASAHAHLLGLGAGR